MSTELLQKLEKAVSDERALNEKSLVDQKKLGETLGETKLQLAKVEASISGYQDEIKALQTAMNRHTSGDNEEKGMSKETKERSEAFMNFLRKGKEGLNDMERKALSVQVDSDGGYLVRPEVSAEIVKKVFESSPMRTLASSQTISTDSFEIIEDLGEADADWVGETGARANTATPELAKIIIPVHEMFSNPLATQKILDDAAINLEAWLAEKVSDKFGRTEATSFISGNGVNKPRGILTYANGTAMNQIEQISSGSAATLTADGLINLSYALKAAYKSGSAFMLKRASIAVVRKLKDSQNQYLWQPSLQLGQPDMLLGFPMYEADDMEAVGANTLAVAFGNFKASYQIVDRMGIRVLRDPFSNKPYVAFYTTKRVGGGVKNFEAIKIQKCEV